MSKQLPPDPEQMNDERAEWAFVAIEAFARQTRQKKDNQWDATFQEVVSDLLTDLMHFCDRNDISMDTCLNNALGHYHEETLEEECAP